MTYNTKNMLVMTVTTFITATIFTAYSNPVAAATSALQPQLAEIHRLPKTLQEVLSRGLSGSDPHGPEHEEGFKVVMGQPRPGESPIYYIKLPPTPRFYSYSPPYKNRIGKQIPMNFTINGKPKKVYHWNLPYRKKVAEYRRLLSAPFHPFNHRSSADTFGTFITKQELAVPKPITDLALPSLNTNPIRNTELKTDDSEDNVETKIFESRNVRRKLNSDVIVEHEIGEKESKKLLATETSATNTAGGHSSPQTDLKTPAVSIDKQGRDIEKPPSINGEVETRFQTPLFGIDDEQQDKISSESIDKSSKISLNAKIPPAASLTSRPGINGSFNISSGVEETEVKVGRKHPPTVERTLGEEGKLLTPSTKLEAEIETSRRTSENFTDFNSVSLTTAEIASEKHSQETVTHSFWEPSSNSDISKSSDSQVIPGEKDSSSNVKSESNSPMMSGDQHTDQFVRVQQKENQRKFNSDHHNPNFDEQKSVRSNELGSDSKGRHLIAKIHDSRIVHQNSRLHANKPFRESSEKIKNFREKTQKVSNSGNLERSFDRAAAVLAPIKSRAQKTSWAT